MWWAIGTFVCLFFIVWGCVQWGDPFYVIVALLETIIEACDD